jgi:ADP-ribose pyrophosphatase
MASILFSGKHLDLYSVDGWEYVERPRTGGVVVILAITEAQEMILIEQFRAPLGQNVVGLAAGLAGDTEKAKNENLETAARRELIEETGYEAGAMKYLTDGPSSPGMATEWITFFEARGLKKVEQGQGDTSENIQVHLVPMAGLPAWLEQKRKEGCAIDYKIYTALYLREMALAR